MERRGNISWHRSGEHSRDQYEGSKNEDVVKQREEHRKHKRSHSESYYKSDGRRSRDHSDERRKYRRVDYESSKDPKTVESYVHSDSGEEEDFTFERYKYELNKMFFGYDSVIRAGSQEHEDFWKFLRKYELVQKKAGDKQKSAEECAEAVSEIFGVPKVYDKRHLISFSVNFPKMKDLLARIPPRDRESGRWISEKRITEFQKVLWIYIDFMQKEKFAKLKKLRESQANLPVAQYRDEIISAIKDNRVVIIAGDTGCGKSTQIPQYLLKAGYNHIACTQPRRIACISLSKRVAFETLNEYASEVGYQIRFERSKTQHTKIVFITEGLLLRQVSTDPTLSTYNVIVLDEIHERHLHGDFLLGLLKCLLLQREDLKVVLMSATINISLFQEYFDEAVVLQVPGRLHPIKLNYRPVFVDDKFSKTDRIDPGPYIQIMQLIDEKYGKDERGDMLIFLSGMSEISTVVEAAKLYAQQSQGWVILPLHSTLSIAEQDKVFDYPPEGIRKCIVSTNIAETSITIDGVRFVVDSGKVKEMTYDPACKMQRLKEFWVSQASAEQRKGRAGRTGPGVCYRLYSEKDYGEMSRYSKPEIQRVPLDSLLLQMMAMGLPDARKFPFIEPPPAESIENSILSLKEQGALTENEKLTTIGKMLSNLPVDIGIGKMLIIGSLFHQVEAALALAAALSVQSPFTNRSYRDPECETSRKELESDHGDPVTLLNAFREWLKVKNDPRSNSRKWCKRRGLEEQRFYEMTKLQRQFKELLESSGMLESKRPDEEMTSAERSLRHGKMRLLKSMKRDYHMAGPKKRKILKIDPLEGQAVTANDDEDEEIDIKDVEFRLSNDSSHVQNLLSKSTTCSYRDLMMLKIIVCSGLHPQVAISDEFNYCKTSSEQLFHTRGKPFVLIHPMGFFAHHPQVLQLEESDIVVPEGFTSRLPVSSKHQVLYYLSLLETTKPYLVNTLRMPAAQTILLFSQSIDTNATFSRFVCDSWLQLEFPTAESGEALLLKVTKLRAKLEDLLAVRLQDISASVSDERKSKKTASQLERELSLELPQFMHTEVCYTIKRLLAADLKILYFGTGENEIEIEHNPFHKDWKCLPHPLKGGMQVTEYLTFNCLSFGKEVPMEDLIFAPWKCDNCEITVCLAPIERLEHMEWCKPQKSEDAPANENQDSSFVRKPNSQAYECSECGKTLYLTPTEILRHKKQHTVK